MVLTDNGILTIWFKLPVRTISPKVNWFWTPVTLNSMSISWILCGRIVNQDGLNRTVVPLGGKTEPRYVSVLLETFWKLLLSTSDPLSAEIVTDGWLRLAGWLRAVVHQNPVVARTITGLMFGSEHKKLM